MAQKTINQTQDLATARVDEYILFNGCTVYTLLLLILNYNIVCLFYYYPLWFIRYFVLIRMELQCYALRMAVKSKTLVVCSMQNWNNNINWRNSWSKNQSKCMNISHLRLVNHLNICRNIKYLEMVNWIETRKVRYIAVIMSAGTVRESNPALCYAVDGKKRYQNNITWSKNIKFLSDAEEVFAN